LSGDATFSLIRQSCTVHVQFNYSAIDEIETQKSVPIFVDGRGEFDRRPDQLHPHQGSYEDEEEVEEEEEEEALDLASEGRQRRRRSSTNSSASASGASGRSAGVGVDSSPVDAVGRPGGDNGGGGGGSTSSSPTAAALASVQAALAALQAGQISLSQVRIFNYLL